MTTADSVIAGAASRQALKNASDTILLHDPTGRSRTGTELTERVERLAGALADTRTSEVRIGVLYRNSLAAVEAFLAVEWLGAARVTVDPDVPAAEAQSVFDAADVHIIITDSEHADAVDGNVLVHDDDSPVASDRWTEAPEVPATAPLVIYPRAVAGGELFSVTTSYGNWNATMQINCDLFRQGWYGDPIGPGDRLLTVQQLMHGTGMVASFPFLLMGLPQVLLPKFHAQTVLETIEQHGITTTFVVPKMLQRLADQLGDVPTKLPLRHTLYGGAPLDVDELRRVRRVLGNSLIQLYGRFEAGWPLTILGPDEHTKILQGNNQLATSCGLFVPQIETRLVPVPERPSGYGELQTRNAMVSAQYADPQGWCALGDVAYQDNDGYLYLAGRLDDMINTGSYHVYPRQVAEAIQEIPGVLQAKVTGEPDPVWGQAVTAYIVPDNSQPWDDLVAQLETELSKKLARYKIPKQYHKVNQLP